MTNYQIEFALFLTFSISSGILFAVITDLIDRRKIHQAPRRSTFFGK